MVLASSIGEPSRVIKHPRLTQSKVELHLDVVRHVCEHTRAVEVGVGRGGIFFLEEQADDVNVDS
jgi:hypothetical protein